MISKEDIIKVNNGEITTLFHKIHGKGNVVAVREDKLAGKRLKATIEFTIPDLLEDKTQPEFLYLDDENLSVNEWQ